MTRHLWLVDGRFLGLTIRGLLGGAYPLRWGRMGISPALFVVHCERAARWTRRQWGDAEAADDGESSGDER